MRPSPLLLLPPRPPASTLSKINQGYATGAPTRSLDSVGRLALLIRGERPQMVTVVLHPFHEASSLPETQGYKERSPPGRTESATALPARREAEAGGLQPAAEEVRTFLHGELGSFTGRLCSPLCAHHRSGV